MSELVHTIGIKVDPETYRLYKYELRGREKEMIINTVRQILIQLIKKPETISQSPSQKQEQELTLKIEVEHKEEKENQFLELRKRIQKLENEISKLLEENAGLKNELDTCREQLKKPSDQLEKELAQIKREYDTLKRELENYKYYVTVIYIALQEVRKSNDMSKLGKVIQYVSGKIDNNAIERAQVTAHNILK